MSRRNANKLLAILHGIFEYAVRKHGLLSNPARDVEKLRESYDAARFDFYSPEEVGKLVAKAESSQDGVVYLTAAFSGLRRGELVALLWEDDHTQPKDPVFAGEDGEPIDGSALRRRHVADLDRAGLRFLRFHDLRHTFGSLAINSASIVQVQAWMGHADIKTTMRYLHHKSRADDARLLSSAFRPKAKALDEAA